MGFNHRKLEDQRREAVQKEAAKRRATDAQVIEDAERLIAAWKAPGQANAYAVLADNRRCHHSGAVPGLPNDQCNRLAWA
jgi:beta-phosphoglucomutase-like phosphatase (HAD superfamily)